MNQPIKKNKNYTLKHLFIFGLLLATIPLIFFTQQKEEYSPPTASFQLYDAFTSNPTTNTLDLTLSYEHINTFLHNTTPYLQTSNTSIRLSNLHINAKNQQFTGRILHDYLFDVNFSASFDLSLVDDQLVLNIKSLRLGKLPSFIALPIYKLFYPFHDAYIPLNSTPQSLLDDYLNTYLDNAPLEFQPTDTGFIATFSELLTYPYELYPMETDLPSQNYPTHHVDDKKYIQLSQMQLMKTSLESSNLLIVLKKQGLEGTFLHNTSDDVILRVQDPKRQIVFDLNLVFNFEVLANKTLQLKLDHIQTPSGRLIQLSNTPFISSVNKLIKNYDTRPLEQYNIVRSDLNLTHLHLYYEQTSWTIMVYMIGSDLESSYDFYNNRLYGSASADLEEMMAGNASDNIHVVVETGGTKNWLLDTIEPGTNQRWKIGNNSMELLDTLGTKNMSDPDTLYDFTSWAINSYPSDNYALILWDHGGGSLYGFGLDEYFPDDSLTLDEMDTVLATVTHEQNMKFEVVGFDACLMATLETAAMLEPYAHYLIASEETEPDYGWDYERVLTQLGDGEAFNGKKFGELVVSGFFDASIEENQDSLLTLSVIDLKYIPTVIQRMNKLFESILTTEKMDLLSKTIPQVKALGGNTALTGYTDHYDIENFAKRTMAFLPAESNRLLAAVDDAVIYKAHGYLTTDAGGLSFYFPFYDFKKNSRLMDLYAPVAFSESYLSFLNKFVAYHSKNSVSSTQIPYTLFKNERPYQLRITEGFEDQVSNVYLGVSAFIDEDNQAYRLDLGYDIWIYEGFDPRRYYEESFGYWPSLNGYYMPISVVYNGLDYVEYETPIRLNGEPIMLITAWIYDEERYAVLGGRPIVQTEGLADRNTIEFKEGDQIELIYSYYNKSTNEWFEDVPSSLTYTNASSFNIMNQPFKKNAEYGLSFIIQDKNGTLSYTDMIRFIYK